MFDDAGCSDMIREPTSSSKFGKSIKRLQPLYHVALAFISLVGVVAFAWPGMVDSWQATFGGQGRHNRCGKYCGF